MNISLLPKFLPRNEEQRRADLERAMLRREAEIGGKLFGQIPKGHSRQFFCFDEQTWIWYESWKAKDGTHHTITTKYETRPNGILKSQDGQPYQEVGLEEARNLYRAVELYQERVDADYKQLIQNS